MFVKFDKPKKATYSLQSARQSEANILICQRLGGADGEIPLVLSLTTTALDFPLECA